MEFTGERFVPGTPGQIKLEHLQRYVLCREAVRDKRVLDIACGEGYGSSMLAATARHVLGVDLDPATVEHARLTYGHLTNVDFFVGACDRLLLPDGAVDVVVSFETIEHHAKHAEMIREVKRVLAPGGLFIMSSPNKPVYSTAGPNPFHVRELTFEELEALLGAEFGYLRFWGQRSAVGCFTYGRGRPPAESPPSLQSLIIDGHDLVHRVAELENPVYFLAVCSETPIDLMTLNLDSVIIEPADDLYAQLMATIQRYVTLQQQAQAATGEMARVREELEAGRGVAVAREADLTHLREALEASLARLVQHEAEADRLSGELESARAAATAREAHTAQLRLELETTMRLVAQRESEAAELSRALETTSGALAAQEAQTARARWELEATRTVERAGATRARLELVAQQADITRLGQELAMTRHSLTNAQASTDGLRAELATIRSSGQTIVNSWSWKVATPWRWLRLALSYGREIGLARAAVSVLTGQFTARLRLRHHLSIIDHSGSFDEAWYLTQYPDVACATLEPMRHYLLRGAAEGKDPNPSFDSSWYLERYPDVAQAGLNPLVHYIARGAMEGRHPHPRCEAAPWP
jgi:SAM-dependent methyltransferase